MTNESLPPQPSLRSGGPSVGTFTFLDIANRGSIDAALLDQLSSGRVFDAQDQDVFNRIRQSLMTTGELPFPWTQQEAHHIARQPQDKWVDYLIYRYKFVNYPKEKIVADFPVYLLIEPMSVCNLRCVMCYQVDPTFTKKPFMGMMDFDLFCDIVDQAAEGGTQAITLASRGEPTLHPQLPEMLEYLSGKFIEVKLTTNATRLTEDLCHKVLQSGVNILVFSVDAHTKDVYEQIRVRGKFEQVRENIERFNRIREESYPSASTTTRISAVRFRDDQDPVGFKEFWSDMVDEVGMKDAQARWDTYSNDVHHDLTTPCWFLWERMYIWQDGSTNPCDLDYKSHLSSGNVALMPIHDIWHGPELQRLRENHLNGHRLDHSPCDRCGANFE